MLKELAILSVQKQTLISQLKQVESEEEAIINSLRRYCISWVKHKGLHWNTVTGKSRRQELVDFRVAVISFLSNNTSLSLNQIASFLGGKDHTTILYHKNKNKSQKEKRLTQELQSYVENIRS